MRYYRPLVQHGEARPEGAVELAGGGLWFTHAEVLSRDTPSHIIPAGLVPDPILRQLSGHRPTIAGLDLSQPQLVGILNVTPDSFSDGGKYGDLDGAVDAARQMIDEGASLIDIGGESTRPGAAHVPQEDEIARTAPVIAALRIACKTAISIDTRKAPVAASALTAGATLINDVSGFTHDPALAPLAAQTGAPVCIMHTQGDPVTMQHDPSYENVLLDVYDFLAAQIDQLESIGVLRDQIVIDPGIGFGKTVEHNLALLRGIALFHGLGCPILLGVSRKGIIGTIGKEPRPNARAPGSIAVGLAALAQGVQFLRVHDVAETAQALRLWQATR